MKHDRVTTEIQETAALYALGALSQQESQAFYSHLSEGCEVCKTELSQFDQVVDDLGSSAPIVAPPEYLRDLLMARIEREPGKPRAISGPVIAFPEKPGSMKQFLGRVQSGGGLIPWAVAAALLIAFAYTFISWRSDHQSMLATLEQERALKYKFNDENASLKDQINKESKLSAELAQINTVLSSPQHKVIYLAGQGPAPEATARVYWDIQGRRWVITANLPPAPQGMVYQLWFVTSAAKVSAGLIEPDKSGHGFAVLAFPPTMTRVQKTAITLEPDGGSPQPTSDIYALGNVS